MGTMRVPYVGAPLAHEIEYATTTRDGATLCIIHMLVLLILKYPLHILLRSISDRRASTSLLTLFVRPHHGFVRAAFGVHTAWIASHYRCR